MRIITDTASMFIPADEEKYDIKVLPLTVTINGSTYREFIDIGREEFLELVKQGGVPTSSQPTVGEVIEAFESDDEEILAIAMADGLSGTYQTFEGVRQSSTHPNNIHVVNTRTLCGPEKLLVQKALEMREKGCSVEEILEALERSIKTHRSFLIPSDFAFLKRGGRLSAVAATIGGLIKIVPIVMTSDDGKVLEKFTVKRTPKSAVAEIAKYYQKMGVDEKYKLYIAHADATELAEKTKIQLTELFPNTEIEILELTPAFITQGGPGCMAIQAIMK